MSLWHADVDLRALLKESILIKCLKFLIYSLLVTLFIFGNVPLILLMDSALFSLTTQFCKVHCEYGFKEGRF